MPTEEAKFYEAGDIQMKVISQSSSVEQFLVRPEIEIEQNPYSEGFSQSNQRIGDFQNMHDGIIQKLHDSTDQLKNLMEKESAEMSQ